MQVTTRMQQENLNQNIIQSMKFGNFFSWGGKHGSINLILKTLCDSYLPAQPFENVDKSETSTEIDLAISF